MYPDYGVNYDAFQYHILPPYIHVHVYMMQS